MKPKVASLRKSKEMINSFARLATKKEKELAKAKMAEKKSVPSRGTDQNESHVVSSPERCRWPR